MRRLLVPGRSCPPTHSQPPPPPPPAHALGPPLQRQAAEEAEQRTLAEARHNDVLQLLQDENSRMAGLQVGLGQGTAVARV